MLIEESGNYPSSILHFKMEQGAKAHLAHSLNTLMSPSRTGNRSLTSVKFPVQVRMELDCNRQIAKPLKSKPSIFHS